MFLCGTLRLFASADSCGTSTYTRYCTCYRRCRTRARGVRNIKDIRRLLFCLSLYKWPQSYTSTRCTDSRRLRK